MCFASLERNHSVENIGRTKIDQEEDVSENLREESVICWIN